MQNYLNDNERRKASEARGDAYAEYAIARQLQLSMKAAREGKAKPRRQPRIAEGKQTIDNDGLWHGVGRLHENAISVEAPTLATIQLDVDWDGSPLVRNSGPEPVEITYKCYE